MKTAKALFPILLALTLAGCAGRGNLLTPFGTLNTGTGSRVVIETAGNESIEVKVTTQKERKSEQ